MVPEGAKAMAVKFPSPPGPMDVQVISGTSEVEEGVICGVGEIVLWGVADGSTGAVGG
jgi:hypothetical protein